MKPKQPEYKQNSSYNRKRLRVFAGPNGSGKTSLIYKLAEQEHFKLKVFVNADVVEKNISDTGYFDFHDFGLTIVSGELKEYIFKNGASVKRGGHDASLLKDRISIRENRFYFNGEIDSYIAADLCNFCRDRLLSKGSSFIFETVMSHESKIEFIKKAKSMGYKTYLYFISTDFPEINVQRILKRVEDGTGHFVPEKKIVGRYSKSLNLLYDAIKVSDTVFLWDNSKIESNLFAQILDNEGNVLNEDVPKWFRTYVLNKING